MDIQTIILMWSPVVVGVLTTIGSGLTVLVNIKKFFKKKDTTTEDKYNQVMDQLQGVLRANKTLLAENQQLKKEIKHHLQHACKIYHTHEETLKDNKKD